MTTGSDELVVVVVGFGAPENLATCLGALDRRYPVVVIDNSSSRALERVVQTAGARYVDPGSNLGFASAVNLILTEVAAVDMNVLLLNPDAIVTPAVVDQLHEVLRSSPQLACVAPAQRAPGSPTLDRVCWPFPTPSGAWLEAIGLGRLRRSCDFLIGSVLLVRGAALINVGGFDEQFFLYAEETDWQKRAAQHGWGVRLCPELEAVHIGAGTDDDETRRMLRFHTGVERYVRKWYGKRGWAVFRAATLFGAAIRTVILIGPRRRDAASRAQMYLAGPDNKARRAGVVPPPRARVPEFSKEPPS